MRRILIIFLMVATMSFGAEPPRGFKEVGGSNYVMYDVGREYLDSGTGWFKPGVLQPDIPDDRPNSSTNSSHSPPIFQSD